MARKVTSPHPEATEPSATPSRRTVGVPPKPVTRKAATLQAVQMPTRTAKGKWCTHSGAVDLMMMVGTISAASTAPARPFKMLSALARRVGQGCGAEVDLQQALASLHSTAPRTLRA